MSFQIPLSLLSQNLKAMSNSEKLKALKLTLDKIEKFLSFTSRKPEETLGIVLPASRAVTVWATAVNGVMAGCRPEYMPVVVAAEVAE